MFVIYDINFHVFYLYNTDIFKATKPPTTKHVKSHINPTKKYETIGWKILNPLLQFYRQQNRPPGVLFCKIKNEIRIRIVAIHARAVVENGNLTTAVNNHKSPRPNTGGEI